MSGDLHGPTIVVQGLHDGVVWPAGTIRFAHDVIAANASDKLRLYFFKPMGHAFFDPPVPPDALRADAVRALDHWITSGQTPGDLSAGPDIGTQSSCTDMAHSTDPAGCFNAAFGNGF